MTSDLDKGEGRFRNPGASGHRRADPNISEIVNLGPGHDPDIAINGVLGRDCLPVRRRHILNPAHPDRVIDMTEFVYVFGLSGD